MILKVFALFLLTVSQANFAYADGVEAVGGSIFKSLLFIGLLIVAAYLLRQHRMRKESNLGPGRILKVLESTVLANNAKLYVVEFAGRIGLLGLSQAGFCLIDQRTKDNADQPLMSSSEELNRSESQELILVKTPKKASNPIEDLLADLNCR